MTRTDKSLEELVREVPAELQSQVRKGIEALLSNHGRRTEPTGGPPSGASVSLHEVTRDTVGAICGLSETLVPPQKYMVAPNAVSFAQALFEPKAWYRAVYAGETPVGFLMLYDDPDKPEYFLWRLMIATPHQGKGFGRQAVEQLIEYVETRPGATELLVSCEEGPGSPEGFYQALGFRRNGKMYDGEVGLALPLPYRPE